MIIHKLIAHHLKHKDDAYFYQLQADDAVRWIEEAGVPLGKTTQALDLGCGHGVFGASLARRGCPVTFADERKLLLPEIANSPFRQINLDKDDISSLGQFDLVVCSNVFEHLSKPDQFLDSVHKILSPGGKLYLS
jgi:2-polyprenyl-3-methyl-5-hydroxy-6-metoxy-1,4-benzoquinol methylase